MLTEMLKQRIVFAHSVLTSGDKMFWGTEHLHAVHRANRLGGEQTLTWLFYLSDIEWMVGFASILDKKYFFINMCFV